MNMNMNINPENVLYFHYSGAPHTPDIHKEELAIFQLKENIENFSNIKHTKPTKYMLDQINCNNKLGMARLLCGLYNITKYFKSRVGFNIQYDLKFQELLCKGIISYLNPLIIDFSKDKLKSLLQNITSLCTLYSSSYSIFDKLGYPYQYPFKKHLMSIKLEKILYYLILKIEFYYSRLQLSLDWLQNILNVDIKHRALKKYCLDNEYKLWTAKIEGNLNSALVQSTSDNSEGDLPPAQSQLIANNDFINLIITEFINDKNPFIEKYNKLKLLYSENENIWPFVKEKLNDYKLQKTIIITKKLIKDNEISLTSYKKLIKSQLPQSIKLHIQIFYLNFHLKELVSNKWDRSRNLLIVIHQFNKSILPECNILFDLIVYHKDIQTVLLSFLANKYI